MSNLTTAELSQLIERKHECLLGLRSLALRQRELVEEHDLSQLLKLLGTKQQLLTLLQSVERSLEPYREQHPEHRRWNSPEERSRCARLAEESQALLAEVLRQEAESEQRLRARRDETGEQLQAARSANMARQAYLDAPPAVSGSLDLSAG